MPTFQKLDPSPSRAIDQWEIFLAPLFENIHLLGELPLNNTQRKELGQLIRRLIKQHGLTQATRLLKNRYPRVFLTYLALTAARNEERGFWDVVAKEEVVKANPMAPLVDLRRPDDWTATKGVAEG